MTIWWRKELSKISKLIPAAAVALLALGAAAEAATLAGDTVSVNLSTGFLGDLGTQSVLVGAGVDATYFGNQDLDFDDGVDGDIFSITSLFNFCGMSTCAGSGDIVTFTLTSLDFGVPLLGVNILTSIGGAIVSSFTSDSVTFQWTEASIPQGTYFTAQFVTGPSPIPLPASLPLLAIGLAGLAALRSRRKAA